ncbi:hypothetical protein [Ornithinimicrobium sediminis]|uniref:hypothetical protein n=1 Tax=Ornithinimicrobium sediminis TaxID=2904603 RepID=UPI001E2C0379|nr:hypothetical protein [Ornithinimicrobium sediminis]MCE0488142.1 hypothetical protein [Ornithinimicrobium sediminis]
MRKTILGPVLAAALMVGGTGAATAAPPEPEIIPLVCDNGHSYDIVVNGNGNWTPGRIVGSTNVLVPIAFGDFGFRAVTPDGDVYEETFPDEDLKGGGNVAQRNPRPTVTCTFTETFTLPEDDPEFGLPAGTDVTFSGSVTAFLVGR